MENKPKQKRYSEEDFAKLPKIQQEKIIKARQERIKALQLSAMVDIESLANESTSEREFNAKFNKIYTFVRKGLVVLSARKKLGDTTGETLYSEVVSLLDRAKEI